MKLFRQLPFIIMGTLAAAGAVAVLSFVSCRMEGVMECLSGDPVKTDRIIITSPLPHALIQSPLVVQGKAWGMWYFEASFPVRILDANGMELAVVPAQAQGEWMTTEFVPFKATVVFETPMTTTGTVVFEKDNPSGLPEYADAVSVPVRFGPEMR